MHDYEVGIATENSPFPDVMTFTSSHHHQHIRLFQPDLFNGERFSIMIKAITKSDISDIQVCHLIKQTQLHSKNRLSIGFKGSVLSEFVLVLEVNMQGYTYVSVRDRGQ